MTRQEPLRVPTTDHHQEWRASVHEWSEIDCQWYFGTPTRLGLSGHEFTPFDKDGDFVRIPCARAGVWRGLWKCGGCPDTHTVLVCDQCRACHDADAETGEGALMMWVTARE